MRSKSLSVLFKLDDGGGEYRVLLKTPWSDGTSSIQLNTWELMERLIALIPPPRSHQVLYHGVFANNAKYRRQVLPKYRVPVNNHMWWKQTKRGCLNSKHVSWAELLYRTFGVRGWVCEVYSITHYQGLCSS